MQGADDACVLLTLEDGLGEVALDRPDKLNAMHDRMVEQLLETLDRVESSTARALLIRGNGRAFCAGRDLGDADPAHEDGGEILTRVFNPLMERMAGLRLPTFAAVQGACLGTGLGLALACDVVYAADDARLGSPFARIGAVLDSGSHAALVTRVGAHRALELIYSGRLLSGREAEAWGLVNRSVAGIDLVRRTRELAHRVAQGPTTAFLESKQLVRRLLDERVPYTELLAAEAAAQSRASHTSDYRRGIAAFQEKRVPAFEGR